MQIINVISYCLSGLFLLLLGLAALSNWLDKKNKKRHYVR